MTKQKAYMIVDLQYGSTGKGLLAGYLARTEKPDVVVTAWGPNAGHTYIDDDGRVFIHRMLANGIVSPELETVLIGPGSVIDLDVLMEEIISCADLLQGKRIIIHPHAVVVNESHRRTERRNIKIGSTMKGTGAAMIQRIERDPDNINVALQAISVDWSNFIYGFGVDIFINQAMYNETLANAKVVQIEGAQGFSLSMYHGFYPYTTSRDVTPAQVMADCAIPYKMKPEVYGTLRTFPIRVSDRVENGVMVGTSGPCYSDQKEISWDQLNMEAELTTVTKLPRRLFTFSVEQLKQACHHCGPSKLFLNFANYMDDAQLGRLFELISCVTDAPIAWLGVGPSHNDVIPNENK